MITTAPPTVFDCQHLMSNLRPHDEAEVVALGGRTATELWDAVRASHEAQAVFEDGKLVCIYGINPHPAKCVGIVWLLGTPLLDSRMISLCKQAREVIARWQQSFAVLTNCTDSRNTRILVWLRWLGFRLVGAIPVNGHNFIQFEKTTCATQSR